MTPFDRHKFPSGVTVEVRPDCVRYNRSNLQTGAVTLHGFGFPILNAEEWEFALQEGVHFSDSGPWVAVHSLREYAALVEEISESNLWSTPQGEVVYRMFMSATMTLRVWVERPKVAEPQQIDTTKWIGPLPDGTEGPT